MARTRRVRMNEGFSVGTVAVCRCIKKGLAWPKGKKERERRGERRIDVWAFEFLFAEV